MNSKSKAFLAYIVIFLIGGASGYILNKAINPRLSPERFERRSTINRDIPTPFENEVPPNIKRFITNRLDLRDDQIEPFFEYQLQHMQKVVSVIRDNRRSEKDTLRKIYYEFIDDVDDIITEEQIEKLNRFAHPDSVQNRRMQRKRERGRR